MQAHRQLFWCAVGYNSIAAVYLLALNVLSTA